MRVKSRKSKDRSLWLLKAAVWRFFFELKALYGLFTESLRTLLLVSINLHALLLILSLLAGWEALSDREVKIARATWK